MNTPFRTETIALWKIAAFALAVMSDDCSWPFWFLNVCEILIVTPAHLRPELICDESLGVICYWMRAAGE
jgi:hypothetical protein